MSDKAPGSPNNRRKITMKLTTSFGLKKKTKTRTASEQMVIVQKALPTLGQEGQDPCVGFVCFADRTIQQTLYLKADNEIKKGFLANTDCVPRVCQSSKDGAIIANDWNNNSYPRKAITCMIDADEADIRAHVNGNIAESLQFASKHLDEDETLKWDQKGLQDSALPKMRDGQDYYEVNHWCKVLYRQKDIEFVIGGACNGTFSSWIKSDKNHLYAVYPEGEVPLSIMRKYNLNGSHLRAQDKTRLIDDMEAQAAEAVAGLAKEASGALKDHNANP
ncbi:MAG: hypothetical protein SGARI_003373 [Bacillariaceae sp.]